MQIQFIKKDLNYIYIFLFMPIWFRIKNTHKMEHRIFLHPLFEEKDWFKFNNWETIEDGIRIRFVIEKSKYADFIKKINKIFWDPLPKWTKNENKRFSQEIREYKDDKKHWSNSFIAEELWYKKFYAINWIKENRAKEEEIWTNIDKNKIRILVIWDIKWNNSKWKIKKFNYKFPILKTKSKKSKSYTIIMYNDVWEKLINYAVDFFYNQILTDYLNKNYVDIWKIYALDEFGAFQDGYNLSWMHLESFSKKLLDLPEINLKLPTKEKFEEMKEEILFSILSDCDKQYYAYSPVIWFLPEEEYEAIKNLKYSTLKDYWEDKIKTISIIDYDAVSSSKK